MQTTKPKEKTSDYPDQVGITANVHLNDEFDVGTERVIFVYV